MATAEYSSASDIPTFLRFLTQEAKLPLSKAMLCLKNLQKEGLSSPAAISTSNMQILTPLTLGVDDAKRVLNAAKRVTKRSSSSTISSPARGKKRKLSPTSDQPTPQELEDSLALPEAVTDLETLRSTILYTNRAPLLLAFAVVLQEYTMPNQPLSSRLSLAQAMVSAGAREKAVYLGIESGKSAEEEGFGAGQPVVQVMSKEVRVLKRWGYEWPSQTQSTTSQNEVEKETIKEDPTEQTLKQEQDDREEKNGVEDMAEPALWGLDLEALKKSNSGTSSAPSNFTGKHGAGLPIYTPQSARSYLLRSFASAQSDDGPVPAKKGVKQSTESKERNLGLLLGALKVLYQSWSGTLDQEELNKRAWSWYVAVRPDVEHGAAGWGGKGEVRLAKLVSLRKQ